MTEVEDLKRRLETAVDALLDNDAQTASLREKLRRSEELRIGAEQQASRAIARLANVVEMVRARADGMTKAGMHDYAAVLRGMATELQRMELP